MSETEIATFKLGEAAKVFIQSDLGKYLDGCSLQDLEQAKDDLLDLDPYAFISLVDLQNKIVLLQLNAKIAQKMRVYLAEIVERGRQSEHQLETEE